MKERNNKAKSALKDYVTVAIAEDIDLANEYRDILARNNIPAVTATRKNYVSAVLGIAVMVPENFLEQAQDLIESRQEFDHFIDDAFNDEGQWVDEPEPGHEPDYLDEDNDDDEFEEENY